MKKSLVLAMAMALGVTASAYAANPFSDVPAGHWAYDAVNELAAAGVVEGYGDGTYAGDKLITRYEMAQIVAKAMAKGADCDKLAAEFASELDTLGVRVAALEKKADNVKITGQVRFRYIDTKKAGHTSDMRTRLFLKGAVNEDWSYTGMIEHVEKLGDGAEDGKTKLRRAWVDGKVGGMAVTGGRYNGLIASGYVLDTDSDGIKASYGSKVKVSAEYAQGDGTDSDEYTQVSLSGKVGALGLSAGYAELEGIGAAKDKKIFMATAATKVFGLDAKLTYLQGIDAGNVAEKDGYVVDLGYKGAKASQPGSWGIYGQYFDQPACTYVKHTSDAETFTGEGFEGYAIGANYALAKNVVATFTYFDTESKKDGKDVEKYYSNVVFSF